MTKTNSETSEKISPFEWLTLKTSILQGLIKFKILFLNIEYEGEFEISESILFHPTNSDGNSDCNKLPRIPLLRNL